MARHFWQLHDQRDRGHSAILPLGLQWWVVVACTIPFGCVWIAAAITRTLAHDGCNPEGVLRLVGSEGAQHNVCSRAVLLADLPTLALGIMTWLLLVLHVCNVRAIRSMRGDLIAVGLLSDDALTAARGRAPTSVLGRLDAVPRSLRVPAWIQIVLGLVAVSLGVGFYLLAHHNGNLFADLVKHQRPPADHPQPWDKFFLRDTWWANWDYHKVNTIVWAAVGVGPAAIGFRDQYRINVLVGMLRDAKDGLEYNWEPAWQHSHLGTPPLERLVVLKEWGGILLFGGLATTFYLVRTPTNSFSWTNVIAMIVILGTGLNWYLQYHSLQTLIEEIKRGAVDRARKRYTDLIGRWRSLHAVPSPRLSAWSHRRELEETLVELELARTEAEQIYLMSLEPHKTLPVRTAQVALFSVTALAAIYGAIPNLFR